jgi:type IV secretion system protein TrbL
MTSVARALAAVVVAAGLALAAAPDARALPPAAGVQPGRVARVSVPEPRAQTAASCKVHLPVVGPLVSEVAGGACNVASGMAGVVTGLAGEAANAVGNGILDLLANWMIGAATQITTFVARAMAQTSTPALESAWFQAQFAPMADLGAALALLVALIALGSAAVRRSPHALAATIAGIVRAGVGTSLVVALTATGLQVADQISAAVVSGSPHAFWTTVAHAWGSSGFGGFGSSALAMLIALVEVFAAVFVWLELIVRDAAIYVAVLLFPVGLAASIWPALGAWPARLGRLLLLFVILKPLTLIVLSLAGSAAAAGLSFGSGVPGSVGTILSAVVIFALAAFAPWALMHLLAADAESAHTASGLRTAAGAAVLEKGGRSVRSGGGLTALSVGGGGPASPRGGGFPGGGGPPSGPGGGAGPSPGGPPGARAGGVASTVPEEGTLPLGAELGASGSVGVAAGMSASHARRGAGAQREPRPRAPTSAPRSAQTHEGDEGTDGRGRDGGQVIALPPRDSLASLGDQGREHPVEHNPPDGPPPPVAFLHRPGKRREDSAEGRDE